MRCIAYLSLGSNLGDREKQIRQAIEHLQTAGHVISVSSLYETEPVERTDQPWFLNVALALDTSKTAEEVMRDALDIEHQMGRLRVEKKGPRAIDIDIVLFGNRIINSPTVTIPHPRMPHRRFVLEPLAEIAPQARHPQLNKTVRELLDGLPAGQVARRIEKFQPGT